MEMRLDHPLHHSSDLETTVRLLDMATASVMDLLAVEEVLADLPVGEGEEEALVDLADLVRLDREILSRKPIP